MAAPFSFEEATAPFSFEEAKEEPSSFEEAQGATVAQMASATRHTVGVVGRAIAARDFAVSGYDAPDRSQLEDGYQPDESALAPLPGNIEPKAVRALPAMASNLGRAMMMPLPTALGAAFPRITAQEVSDALSMLASGSPDLTEDEAQAVIDHTTKPGNMEKIIAGAQRAAVSVPEAFTSPFGIATMGAGALPGTLGRAVAGGFAVDMASHIPEQVSQLKAAIANGDSERITEASGNLLVTGAMVAATGKHALTKPKTPLEQVAPLTAEATAKVTPIDTKPAEAPLPPAQSVEVSITHPLSRAEHTAVLNEVGNGIRAAEATGDRAAIRSAEDDMLYRAGSYTETNAYEMAVEKIKNGTHEWVSGFGLRKVAKPSPTPLTTAAVESIKAKEPAPEAPAPAPTAATAGVEPPAKPSVTPEFTIAKQSETQLADKAAAKAAYRGAVERSKHGMWRSAASAAYYGKSANLRPDTVVKDLRAAGYSDVEIVDFMKARGGHGQLEAEAAISRLGSNLAEPAGKPALVAGADTTPVVKDSLTTEPLKVTAPAQPSSVKPEGERALTTATVPEHLRPAKSTQDILDSQLATPPAEGGIKPKMAEAPEGGAILGIGGRRPAPPRPVGDTPRGDANWLRIPSALRRVGRGLFTEGARAVLGRTRNQVGQELSRATRKHVDVEQELFGMHEATLRTAVRAIPRQRLDAAMTEASQYFREVENGRPAPALSPEAQSLVDAWFAIGRSTGDIARANNVMVFDPALGAHRPMGHVENYVPRMFTAEVEAVLRDPQADPALFNRLAQEIATARGIALDVAANELRGVAGRFQANDYMANLELARGAQMPEVFYEYNLRNLAARYLPSYSERMAQIIAYGQRLGPRDAPQRQNLWDVARRESEDSYTQEWLNTAEDQGTGFKTKSSLERAARRMQALASATLLSDPTTTVPRNLLSGIAATTEAYGVGRSVRQLIESARLASRLGARELGAIRDDLASFLNSDQLGDSALDNAIRRTSEFTLRASGFTGSENFVRTHNAMVASSFARDAAAALAANPASKLSREALAQFQRWNINPEAIITEGGNWRTGPETRRYVRTAVREMQGGYKFDQVPLWANSTAGRFFYQYGRWGVQRSQNIFQNIIRPAIGEDVQFRGQRMTHRDVLPLIRAGALLIGLGETFGAISYGLFGRDRRDSSLSEIAEAWSEDELKAVGLLGERMVNDIIMAGTLGIIGQPLDIAKAAKDQSRFKNPLDPPSAAGVKAFVSLAQRAVDQDGTLTRKDWLDAASSVARGPKNVTDVTRHHLGESLYEGQNDQRTLRNAALRWAKETKEDVPIRGGGKDFRKSPTAPAYEAVNEALLSGNAEAARKAADKFIEEANDKAKARTAVKSSVRARQPFRAGNLTSDAQRNEFMRWAEKNLSAADLEQIKRVQERYEKTSSDAGLN